MLEPHPPHHTPNTWKDFFLHIATIVVGLLIAVGLEQAVEALHHRHQRAELRDSMERESQQVLHDARSTTAAVDYHMRWLQERSSSVRDSVWSNKPIAPPAPYKLPLFDYPDDPIWRSAKTSGIVELLTPGQVNAYSEIELLSGKVSVFYDQWRAAAHTRTAFEKEFPILPDGSPDFSRATQEDKRAYLKLLMAETSVTASFRAWNGDLIGAEGTILRGDMDLEHIFAAEKQEQEPPDGTPPAPIAPTRSSQGAHP